METYFLLDSSAFLKNFSNRHTLSVQLEENKDNQKLWKYIIRVKHSHSTLMIE